MSPVTVKTVEHAEASELPETKWFWRRLFAFGFTLACIGLALRISERVTDIETLRMISRYALWLAGLMCLLYMAGATTDDITKLFAAMKTTRKETLTTADAPASVAVTPEVTTVEAAPPGGATSDELPPSERVRP